ncbi:DUF354 domain-containing protein [Lutimonas halocynthiae]|uniref:DUF354 domain-containing protein n=1 Tax=Lutimonas halocynthiae TaxID=1446477 RepID=UPI0025B2BDF8|nr:DUF354 domain-containing protein [Lutimonas halocynthiae]MDN3643390.1 DUF354 domain-containing protein [Lutimonas halocynthiae]
MKILIDIGHPGHVHYFKNLITELTKDGHEFLIVARDRDVIIRLLEKLNLPYINRGKGSNSKIGKLLYMLKADLQILRVAMKFKPDLFLSFSTPYAAQVSSMLGKPHIALTDTEHEDGILSKFTYPFTEAILTPKSYLNDLGEKHIKFNNVIEGLYLHKDYFEPDPDIKKILGLEKNEEYVVIRFVSWNAHHDVGHAGLDNKAKSDLIKVLEPRFKIFISSEGDLPNEFVPYKIDISPEKMHDVLAEASLFIGESATMASESALLGTQAVYINSLPLMGYLAFEQEAGLLRHFESSNGVVSYVAQIAENNNVKDEAKEKSRMMQQDFISPTKFLNWFISSYPSSMETLINDPNYESRFR